MKNDRKTAFIDLSFPKHPHTYITPYIDPQGSLPAGTAVGGVLGGLVLLALLVFIAICVGVVLYGYKHPTSKIGLFMIEVCATYTCCILLEV